MFNVLLCLINRKRYGLYPYSSRALVPSVFFSSLSSINSEPIDIRSIQSQKKTSYFAYKLTHRLNILFKKSNLVSALELFTSLVQINNKQKLDIVSSGKKKTLFVRPSLPVYNTMLKGLRDHGCPVVANKIFVDMKKRSLIPNSISYLLLIDSVIQRAIIDSRESNVIKSEYTKQITDPMNFCWDKFQEFKASNDILQDNNDARIVLNVLIKSVGILSNKSSPDLEVLRMIFSPYESEASFPLSPGFNIIPFSDTISTAIKAALNLDASVSFFEAYLNRAMANNITIDSYILCSILSGYRKYISNLPMNSVERVSIADKAQNLVVRYIKNSTIHKSALVQGLLLTIYISCALTIERDRFLAMIIDHYLSYAKFLRDPICFSLYLQAILLKNDKDAINKATFELLKIRREFKTWSFTSQIEILSHFIPIIANSHNLDQKTIILRNFGQLEDSGIFEYIKMALTENQVNISSELLFKVERLRNALRILKST